ncbi:MAG: isoprenylcysteine carboxylmethyltransferase family protein [Candidatus Hydrogenedentes bacterium]|nr:isoprenylcysteine carboxylmethyltransferase family protein [Candidatus Hydrogenedentota bacterium]
MVAVRAMLYASTFVGILFLYVPYEIAQADGGRVGLGMLHYSAFLLYVPGAVIAIWCVAGFIGYGHGTPAPFDPPRQLVARGPYRWVRNPMYVGGFLFMLGQCVWFGSPRVAIYLIALCVAAELFVIFYEEPTLKRKFGGPYKHYLRNVPRWIPRPPRTPTENIHDAL